MPLVAPPPLRAPAALTALALALAAGASAAAPAAPNIEQLAAADTLYAHQDWAKAARAYEAIARAQPQSLRAWYRMGVAYSALREWKRAEWAYRQADALGIPPQFARYNLACVFARQGQRDSAFAVLGRVMDGGFRQPDQLVADADLAGLKDDARFAALVERAKRNATPCAYTAESRQFDFWIGDWDVFDNTRSQARAGESHVESILGGCVIFENWRGVSGVSGKSFNAWNAQLGYWQQNWMDDSGTVTNYTDGKFADGKMTFVADSAAPGGAPQKLRMTFFALGPDQVRQLGETSSDSGATWTTSFDLNYVRRQR